MKKFVCFTLILFFFAINSQAFGQNIIKNLPVVVTVTDKTVSELRNIDNNEPADTAADVAVGVTTGTVSTIYGGSAATIMSATAGAPIVAGAGGYGAAHLLNKHCFNGDSDADKAARTATYIGATAGTVGSVGAIVTCGAGPAGLAAIGSAVGGGMAAGAITVIAAPAVAAGLVGGACYSVYRFFWD